MRIAIDATYTPSGGAATQLINMSKHLTERDNVLIIFTKKLNIHLFDAIQNNTKITIVLSKLSEISVSGRVFWEQALLPLMLGKYNIDVLFCPGNIAPVFSPVKTVQWIGTIGPFCEDFYRHFSPFKKIKLYINKLFMHMSARKSDAVIFESNYTKRLFVDEYGMNSERSYVIHIGKSEFFYPIKPQEEITLSGKYESFSPYALCVSHLYRYKNIIRMLEAFSKAMATTNDKIKLLFAGSIICEKYYSEINEKIDELNLKQSIVFLGAVSKEDLRYLYSACEFLIFPSAYENFAYTLVEAMCCGSAIACSDTTAMPETCQDAALYFDPNNTEEMAECIKILLDDPNLRRELSEKALQRVKNLPTYKEVTVKTLEIMKDLIATA